MWLLKAWLFVLNTLCMHDLLIKIIVPHSSWMPVRFPFKEILLKAVFTDDIASSLALLHWFIRSLDYIARLWRASVITASSCAGKIQQHAGIPQLQVDHTHTKHTQNTHTHTRLPQNKWFFSERLRGYEVQRDETGSFFDLGLFFFHLSHLKILNILFSSILCLNTACPLKIGINFQDKQNNSQFPFSYSVRQHKEISTCLPAPSPP